jgi:uncharacterized protein GlcG (DUF336 family)
MNLRLMAAAIAFVAPAAANAQDDALVDFQALSPEVAMELAEATLEACRAEGYQVGISVVDRSGVQQVFLRDRFAGPHVVETAFRKAWTAVSFRTDTLALDETTRPGAMSAGIRDLSLALPLGGGVPVEVAGSTVAGIGVSGAPGPDLDDACARTGIEAIADRLPF